MSDAEPYEAEVGSSSGSDVEQAETELDPGVLEEAPAEVHNIVWSDPPLINRKNLFFTEVPGLKAQPGGDDPINYFDLLLTDEFYDLVVEETNAYAEEVFLSTNFEQSRITSCKPLTKAELRVFLGLFLHTGTISINRLHDYWKKNWLFNITCFTESMSRNRFLLILRCLHFARNPEQTVGVRQDKLYRIRPIVDYLRPIVDYFNTKMTEIYVPHRELSLDESMVSWRGRLSFRQYLPGKRHKYGIKTYVLAEPSGLTLKLIVYTGAKDISSNVGHVSTVVLQLMQERLR
ncbi:Transposase IS4 [Popillia japonica]|uniref:Transposase IS4 n=1 Tax=Popillia japonica TaxID=7064 RepID=A0AAW1K2F4_POPJA